MRYPNVAKRSLGFPVTGPSVRIIIICNPKGPPEEKFLSGGLLLYKFLVPRLAQVVFHRVGKLAKLPAFVWNVALDSDFVISRPLKDAGT